MVRKIFYVFLLLVSGLVAQEGAVDLSKASQGEAKVENAEIEKKKPLEKEGSGIFIGIGSGIHAINMEASIDIPNKNVNRTLSGAILEPIIGFKYFFNERIGIRTYVNTNSSLVGNSDGRSLLVGFGGTIDLLLNLAKLQNNSIFGLYAGATIEHLRDAMDFDRFKYNMGYLNFGLRWTFENGLGLEFSGSVGLNKTKIKVKEMGHNININVSSLSKIGVRATYNFDLF